MRENVSARADIRAVLARAMAAAALLATTPLAAHDLWIVPSSFTPALGEPVRLRLMLGEGEVEEAVPRASGGIVRFVAVGPDGDQVVPGLAGYDPAGFLRPRAPGWYTIVYESAPSLTTLDASTVSAYLLEEGLARPPASAGAGATGGAEKPIHELFRRSLKARIHVGAPHQPIAAELAGGEVPAGLPLELVLERVATSASSAREVDLRLLLEGAPLAGARVELRRIADRATGTSARTDAEGRLRLSLAPGSWLATAVHLDAARFALADWASVWSSLTFELR